MRIIGRIVIILFALWLATMAAGIVWSIGLLGVQWPAMSGDAADRFVFWGAAIFASGVTAMMMFLPTLVAVILAEAFSIRSFFIYAFGGIALTLIAYHGVGYGRGDESIDTAPPMVSREIEIAAAAGAVFGAVYWLIAGRKGGSWRGR